MKLYNYFTVKEFFKHVNFIEIVRCLSNPVICSNMYDLQNRLNWIRTIFGYPIIINSGYRTEKHNKDVGGSPTSQHLTLSAVDITCSLDIVKLFHTICQLAQLKHECFGQIIYYPKRNFVHLALPSTKYPSATLFISEDNKFIPFNYEKGNNKDNN